MQCNQFERFLEQQDAAEPLPEPALAHIDICELCRALTADLAAIREAAMGMDAEGIAPPEHIWISLRNQLEAEGIIHEPNTGVATEAAQGIGWWSVLQRPALAGAFLALILVAATSISYQGNSTQMAVHPQFAFTQQASVIPTADNVFKEELLSVNSVNNDAGAAFQRVDAAVADSIHRNLGIVDNLIVLCEKSVREQPGNTMAREYLYGAYQQKAELLATAMDHGTLGGLQ
jgi:hypothetical protein